ncbi:hypothetical protein [Pedobacter gandavensis]|uniref:hypothetical protein n=1 Tax=Pedobacter gandavensis TaxID=2679963 RepID=UPI00292E5525|nr:hypothetical protein [Pedobacter gandavensis]
MGTINLNNLEDRKADMQALGASEQSIKEMEDKMRLGLLNFTVRETKPATNGHVDITYPFKRPEHSENYYFTRFTAAHYKIKPLEEGQSYFVITPKDGGKNDVKKLDHPIDAIGEFKKRDKNCELAVGKDVANKTTLASMENGTVNYVSKDFRGSFYAKPTEQTFYCEEGKGFTAPQAGNMVQGRSVYRDDLVAFNTGEVYKAWVNLDIDSGKKENSPNFKLKSFRDPAYGFDLTKVIQDYKIKELEKPGELEKIDAALRNGERPLVTVVKEGKTIEVNLETAVRYGKLNFFRPDGKPEKRELFLKAPALENQMSNKDRSKENNLAENQALGV